jgi:hypothetical protein
MTERVLGPTGGRRRKRLALLVPFIAIAALILAIGASAGTIGTAAGFEDDDANLVQNSTFDWNSFSPVTWSSSPAAPYRNSSKTASGWGFKGFEDAAVSNTDTGFAGGVKQDDDCATQNPGKAPNKDDLKRIYLATKTVNSRVYLMISWTRIPQNSPSPSAHVGYEFNQADRTVASNFCSGSISSTGLVKRTGGDMLVVYDFEGGNDLHIKLSRWLNNSYSPAPGTCEVNNSTVAKGCWGNTVDLTATGFAEGAVYNGTTAITDAIKPPTATDPSQVEFGEAGIDLTGAGVFGGGSGGTPPPCTSFGTAYAVSRSSGNSQQAAMEDIDGPGAFTITNCGTISIHKKDDANNPLQGVSFTLYADSAPLDGAAPHGAEDIATSLSCSTDANGDCSISNVPFGQYWVVEGTPPSGYTAAADQNVVLSAANASLSLTFTDNRQPASIKVKKVDDDNPANPLQGAVFTLFTDAAPVGGSPPHGAEDTTTGLSCTTAANGECTISNILTPGNYWVVETTTPTGYDTAADRAVSVTLGQSLDISGTPFVNPRKFSVIVIVCRNGSSDSLYPSAVTIDGTSVGNSVGAGDLQAGTTEAELCAISQARKTGLHYGTHKADPITIGQ